MLVPGVPERDVAARYRGSASPQLLDVSFVAGGDLDEGALQAWALQMVDDISFGGAGGDLFHPCVGAAKIVHQRAEGRRGELRFEVAGVAPLFLRTLIESLAMTTGGLASVLVQGAIAPVAGDPASALGVDLLRWLASGHPYLPRWPDPGFRVARGDSGGLALRVRLAAAFDDATREAILQLIYVWRAQIAFYADEGGLFPHDLAQRFEVLWPYLGLAPRELRAFFQELPHARGPSVALLENMLCRFHAQAPIDECEIKA
jgi:hypothetical protein